MKRRLRFDDRTYVIGILNVTPDSFSDGGQYLDKAAAIRHAAQLVKDGADIIDVGGESTRPGAAEVDAGDELSRVMPVIEALAGSIDAMISVDTRKAPVAEAALRAGASIVNDVSGFRHDPDMAKTIARHGAYCIAMHMKGAPEDMQANPSYADVVAEVADSLRQSIEIATASGVDEENVIIDPGIGFGKTLMHNIEILQRLEELTSLGRPICVGTSRKSFIGKALGIDDPADRLAGTIATCVMAVMKGARLLRVHDVKEVRRAVRLTDLIMQGKA